MLVVDDDQRHLFTKHSLNRSSPIACFFLHLRPLDRLWIELALTVDERCLFVFVQSKPCILSIINV